MRRGAGGRRSCVTLGTAGNSMLRWVGAATDATHCPTPRRVQGCRTGPQHEPRARRPPLASLTSSMSTNCGSFRDSVPGGAGVPTESRPTPSAGIPASSRSPAPGRAIVTNYGRYGVLAWGSLRTTPMTCSGPLLSWTPDRQAKRRTRTPRTPRRSGLRPSRGELHNDWHVVTSDEPISGRSFTRPPNLIARRARHTAPCGPRHRV